MNDPRDEPDHHTETIYTCLLCCEDFETLHEDGKGVCGYCRCQEGGDWIDYFDDLENKEPVSRNEDISGPDMMDLYKQATDR